jgi:hypothetical protein
MSDKYYFVVWTSHKKKQASEAHPRISNSILKNIHPVSWAANPPEVYDKTLITTLHFWEEIPEAVALEAEASNWIGIQES